MEFIFVIFGLYRLRMMNGKYRILYVMKMVVMFKIRWCFLFFFFEKEVEVGWFCLFLIVLEIVEMIVCDVFVVCVILMCFLFDKIL